MVSKTLVVFVIVISVVIRWIFNTRDLFTIPPDFRINDGNCKLAGNNMGMIGSEDMALGKYGLLFISSGDLAKVLEEGAEVANPGSMWVMDMKVESSIKLHRLEIESFPQSRRFQPHGIHVSNITNRIHVVSHNGDHSSVDIFSIKYDTECLEEPLRATQCTKPASLVFLTSIRSDLFPSGGLNDVVEKNSNEFFVSMFLRFSFDVT